jgi:hypothetical protein
MREKIARTFMPVCEILLKLIFLSQKRTEVGFMLLICEISDRSPAANQMMRFVRVLDYKYRQL